MQVLILGSGKLVPLLIPYLLQGGHTVTVTDTNRENLNTLAKSYPQATNLEVVLATGPLIEQLQSSGIEQANAFLALTDDDNKNAMAAQMASLLFNIPKVICLISDPERQRLYEELGIRVICPTLVAAEAIEKVLGS